MLNSPTSDYLGIEIQSIEPRSAIGLKLVLAEQNVLSCLDGATIPIVPGALLPLEKPHLGSLYAS
jgi:hypothetical protein